MKISLIHLITNFRKFKSLIFSLNIRIAKFFYRNKKIKEHFIISNLKNISDDIEYKKDFTDFKIKLNEFMSLLKNSYEQSKSLTIYKFGDGDYFFLKRISTGSSKPGNSALSKDYHQINHNQFVENSKKNNVYTCEILKPNLEYFKKCFSKYPDYYAEFNYILVANKWIFKNFSSIGLIGAKEKLDIIKKLMNKKDYQNYIGISKFEHYIEIPQKYACDDPKKISYEVAEKLKNSNVKLYLCGLGLLKNYLLSQLPSYSKAIYLDIGTGIDALAGIIDPYRPYFGNWTNYQFKNTDIYKNIDFMQYDPNKDKLKKFID